MLLLTISVLQMLLDCLGSHHTTQAAELHAVHSSAVLLKMCRDKEKGKQGLTVL